jgi:hypothetical protein
MPIAVFMGLYLRYWRPGKVLECSLIGFLLVMAAIVGRQWVRSLPLGAGLHFFVARSGVRHHHLRISGQRPASVAASARAARLFSARSSNWA